jgi:hypothetical protein
VIRYLAGQPRRRYVEFEGQITLAVISQGNWIRVKRIRLQDVGSGLEKGRVDIPNDVRLCERQQVIVALQRLGPVPETRAPISLFVEAVRLDHGTHRAVEHEDPLRQKVAKRHGQERMDVRGMEGVGMDC